MSNILIIKHGSLGDIVQISGVLRDIREFHKSDKIFALTTVPYVDLLSRCPYVDEVIIDKRLSRLNILYHLKLRHIIQKYKFTFTYDLQNSSRTSFYRKYLFNLKNWSSTETTLEHGTKKSDFDEYPVLERFKSQLERSNIDAKYTLYPDFSWASTSVEVILNKYFYKKFILILPFSSAQLSHKKWPHFNDLIKIINEKFNNFEIVIAPGPNEIMQAKKINAISILNNNKALNIMELTGLIKKSSFVVANDTGPAHIAAHLGKSGVALFGSHTTAKKVSIETNNFKTITVKNLNDLAAADVFAKIKDKLILVN